MTSSGFLSGYVPDYFLAKYQVITAPSQDAVKLQLEFLIFNFCGIKQIRQPHTENIIQTSFIYH